MHSNRGGQNPVNQSDHQSDLSDWAALKAGDRKAFKKIYEAQIEALLQYGKRFSRDAQTIEDCVHDLFVDLWKRRAGLGMTDSIRRYLLVSLRRSIIRQNQKSSRTDNLEQGRELDLPFTGSVEKEIVDEELGLENKSRLSAAMNQLSARQQEAIFLKYHKNLAYEDVAEIMDINYQSVRNLVFNGISKMRSLMTAICMGLVYICWFLINY